MENGPPSAQLRQREGGSYKVWQYFYGLHKNTAPG